MTAQRYYFDGAGNTRPWMTERLSLIPVYQEDSGAFVVSNGRVPDSHSLVIAHALSPPTAGDALSKQLQERHLQLIIVSGYPHHPLAHGETKDNRVYRRSNPVTREYDAAFASCLERFWLAFVGGTIDLTLIEPPEWPESLVAAYLAACAIRAMPSAPKALLESAALVEVLERAAVELEDIEHRATLRTEGEGRGRKAEALREPLTASTLGGQVTRLRSALEHRRREIDAAW